MVLDYYYGRWGYSSRTRPVNSKNLNQTGKRTNTGQILVIEEEKKKVRGMNLKNRRKRIVEHEVIDPL